MARNRAQNQLELIKFMTSQCLHVKWVTTQMALAHLSLIRIERNLAHLWRDINLVNHVEKIVAEATPSVPGLFCSKQ